MTWVQQTVPLTTGLMTLLAAAYESKSFAMSKLFMPIASFAGDTSQTLADGSINTSNTSIIKSATAMLANQANTTAAGAPANVGTAKPIIVKITKRDLWNAELTGDATTSPYRLYTADGIDVTADTTNPIAGNRRYQINRVTGEIYALTTALALHNGIAWVTGATGTNAIVGILEFKPLEGSALNTTQQEISELSGVIQSLSGLIRSQKDTNKNLLNVIR